MGPPIMDRDVVEDDDDGDDYDNNDTREDDDDNNDNNDNDNHDNNNSDDSIFGDDTNNSSIPVTLPAREAVAVYNNCLKRKLESDYKEVVVVIEDDNDPNEIGEIKNEQEDNYINFTVNNYSCLLFLFISFKSLVTFFNSTFVLLKYKVQNLRYKTTSRLDNTSATSIRITKSRETMIMKLTI